MKVLQATHHVQSFKGSSSPHLLLCNDGDCYVAKFHRVETKRALVSEILGIQIAQRIDLPVPEPLLIEIPEFLIRSTPALSSRTFDDSPTIFPATHFGGTAGVHNIRRAYDLLPESDLREVSNIESFAGILAFDLFCGNVGVRKAIFRKSSATNNYQVQFINFDGCFGRKGGFSVDRVHPLYQSRSVYSAITNWQDFEPYLYKLLTISPQEIWEMASSIPLDWRGRESLDLERLIDTLLRRRSRLHAFIDDTIRLSPASFPEWKSQSRILVAVEDYSWSFLSATTRP